MNDGMIKGWQPLIMWIIFIALVAFSTKIKQDSAWRLFIYLLATICLVVAAMLTIDWITSRVEFHVYEMNRARVRPTIALANALTGLRRDQMDLVSRHDLLEISGIIGDDGRIVYTVRAPMMDLPIEFIQDYLEISAQKMTDGELWPEFRHSEFKNVYGWKNSETMLKAAQNMFVTLGWAEKAAGQRSAILNRPITWVADRFGMELKS